MIRELRADGLWLCRPAPPGAKGRVRSHEELWKMAHVRLEEPRVKGLGTELVLMASKCSKVAPRSTTQTLS